MAWRRRMRSTASPTSAAQVFQTLEAAWAKQDVQLVDLKIEFGRDADGNLLVADVIDNDSWRIWPGGRKEAMLDKQVYRDTTEVTDEALRGVLTKYQQVAALTDEFADTPAPASRPRRRQAAGGVRCLRHLGRGDRCRRARR